jgi:hypothetical protein
MNNAKLKEIELNILSWEEKKRMNEENDSNWSAFEASRCSANLLCLYHEFYQMIIADREIK